MQLGNAGGTGQIFQVFSDAGVQEVDYLQVFDRWGNQVFLNRHFQPNDETAGWDGRFRGKAVNPGVFTWVVKVIFKDGSSKILKGDLTVIR